MDRVDKSRIVEAHEPHWPTIWVWVGFLFAFFALSGLIGWGMIREPWWVTALLVFTVAHLMHAHILAFHEAGHGTLCPSRFVNELIGLFIGTLSFQSLTSFRAVHQSHHNYLGTERDEELWPFVIPGTPRLVRVLVAAYELTLGITYTPLLCLRSALRTDSPVRKPADRRRVVLEYALILVVWGGILSAVAWCSAWKTLLVVYVIPGILAGNMHSFRKYTEHMGMLGSTVLSTTRSVVSRGPVGRFLAFSMFNIPYHGVHHRYAKIPQARLPAFAELLNPTSDCEPPPFRSYWNASLDMLRSLTNPRVGAQWLEPAAGSAPPETFPLRQAS